MASNAEALPVEIGGTTREASRSASSRRGALTWVAVTAAGISVAALAAITLSGDDHDVDIPAARYDPRAEVLERRAHLDGQARTIGRQLAAITAQSRARNRTAQLAERAERRGHLDGQPGTIGRQTAAAPEPVYLPGSRHLPTS